MATFGGGMTASSTAAAVRSEPRDPQKRVPVERLPGLRAIIAEAIRAYDNGAGRAET